MRTRTLAWSGRRWLPRVALPVMLALLLLGAAACSGSPSAASTNPPPANAATTAVTAVTFVGTEFKLEPATLTVPVGQPVRLTFINKGTIEHDWEAEGFKATNVRVISTSPGLPARLSEEMRQKAAQGIVHPMAGAGQQVVLEFTATAAGTFQAACQIPGHKEAGMRGTLVVR